jgi:hypothetical protein
MGNSICTKYQCVVAHVFFSNLEHDINPWVIWGQQCRIDSILHRQIEQRQASEGYSLYASLVSGGG